MIGWDLLLGEDLTGRVLCVDVGLPEASDAFRLLGAQVNSITLASLDDGEHSAIALIGQIRRALEDALSANEGLPVFDLFVLNDMRGRVLNSRGASGLVGLLKAANKNLKPGGRCYLGFRNTNAIFNHWASSSFRDRKKLLSPKQVLEKLTVAGFPPALIQSHPFLLEVDRIVEVLPARGYRSVKNATSWRERIKERCYGGFGANRFAPGYGLVANMAPKSLSFVDALAHRLASLPDVPRNQEMLRCQILADGKAFFSFGAGTSRYGQLIVVVTRNRQSVIRRKAEAAILDRLRATLPQLVDRLPRVIDSGSIGQYQYYVYPEFPGMTIEGVVPGVDIAERNAMHFIADLHRMTAESIVASELDFQRIIGPICGQAISRYPSMQTEVRSLAVALKARWIGQKQLVVWMHGDFKLENVVIDPSSLAVAGVIDWELSTQHGLPMLDALYLLAYARRSTKGTSYENVYREMILPWQFTAHEQDLLNTYLAAIPYFARDQKMWAGLYLLHELGVRRMYDLSAPGVGEAVRSMLRDTINALSLVDGSRTGSCA